MATLEKVFLGELGAAVSMAQILLFRSGAQLLLVALVGAVWTRKPTQVLETRHLRVHLLRGAVAAFSSWCYFMSLQALPLAMATTLTFSSQLFVLLLVWPMLRERVTLPPLLCLGAHQI